MIYGDSIYLRPILKSDLANLNKWKNDENTYKYLGGGFNPVSIDQQEKWLDSLIEITNQNKRYIICQKKDDRAIGVIGLYGINWIHRVAEIGLYIGEPGEKGKGYAQEAYNLLEDYTRNYLNLRKLKLNAVEVNDKATKLWTRLGYKTVGTLKQERFINGRYCNLLIMEKFI